MGYTREQVIHETLPAGQYPAKITDIELDEDGQFGPQFKFIFNLPTGEDGEKRALTGWTSDVFSNRSKLYSWCRVAVFNGEDVPRDYILNTDDFLGKYVFRLVTVEKREDGTKFNKIKEMMPYHQQVQVQAEPDF